MIAIVDYGLGNVQAIANVYKALGVDAAAASTPESLADADRIILPGVGSFDQAMTRLDHSGMRDELDGAVLDEAKPVLGICVGMQMMARRSEEGNLDGLGWIAGEVQQIDVSHIAEKPLRPHMGWNSVAVRSDLDLFRGLASGSRFYFLHSYAFVPDDQEVVLAETEYGGSFVSSFKSDNSYGVQFHPEKSHRWGVTLLKNFAEI